MFIINLRLIYTLFKSAKSRDQNTNTKGETPASSLGSQSIAGASINHRLWYQHTLHPPQRACGINSPVQHLYQLLHVYV